MKTRTSRFDQIAAEAREKIKAIPTNPPWMQDEEMDAIIKSAIEKATGPLITAIKTSINENDMMPLFMALDEPIPPAAHASEQPPATDDQQVENLARDLHDIYERLAPDFDYETRKETREFDPQSPNGRLMIAVCRELQFRALRSTPSAHASEHCPVCDKPRDVTDAACQNCELEFEVIGCNDPSDSHLVGQKLHPAHASEPKEETERRFRQAGLCPKCGHHGFDCTCEHYKDDPPPDTDSIKPPRFTAGGIINKIIAETPQADFRGRLQPPATEWIPLADGRGKCGVKDKEGWIARGLTEHQAMTISAAHKAALAAERRRVELCADCLKSSRAQLAAERENLEATEEVLKSYEGSQRFEDLTDQLNAEREKLKPLVEALEAVFLDPKNGQRIAADALAKVKDAKTN